MNCIVETVYVVQLRHPNGDREELSGCDSDTYAGAEQVARLVERWLVGGVLYSNLLPDAAVEGIYDLMGYLGPDRFRVGVEVVEKSRAGDEVVWSSAGPADDDQDDDDDDTDTATEWDAVAYTVENAD